MDSDVKSPERENSLNYQDKTWDGSQRDLSRNIIETDDWLVDFDQIISSCDTPILDLGCGSGNDTLYLIQKGKRVISCDQSANAIENIRKNFPEIYDAKCFDMLDGLPFEDNSFQVVIADLCLHYFREKDTFALLDEIRRILTDKGYLIFRVNSINDKNHGIESLKKSFQIIN